MILGLPGPGSGLGPVRPRAGVVARAGGWSPESGADEGAVAGGRRVPGGALKAMPASPEVDKAIYQCDRLHLALRSSHNEGTRFAAFTVNKIVRDLADAAPHRRRRGHGPGACRTRGDWAWSCRNRTGSRRQACPPGLNHRIHIVGRAPPTAHRLPPTAYRLPPTAYRRLPTAYRLPPAAPHHTRHRFSGAIGAPALQLNASWNSGMLLTVPFVRNRPDECGSVKMRCSASASVEFWHHTCAKPRKKRCSGVKPSTSGAVAALQGVHQRHERDADAAVVADVLAERELAVEERGFAGLRIVHR